MKLHHLLIVFLTFSSLLSAAELPPPSEILKLLNAKGRHAGTPDQVAAYHQHFNRIDQNSDNNLSREEFVDKGTYLNARSRAAIFRTSDRNNDNSVSREEYVVNRRITDEAKAIMDAMDKDKNRRISREEFIKHSKIKTAETAESIFNKLDSNQDGATVVPEYLRVWGVWARAVPKSKEDATHTTERPGSPNGAIRGGPPTGRRNGPPDPAALIKRFDRNKDGAITESETPEFLWSRIKTADTDEDGKVTLKELKARRPANPQRP